MALMTNAASEISIVILAAGLGTRMQSDKAKVLHEINGRPMVSYVVDTARAVAGNNVVLVIGHQADLVRETVARQADLRYALQEEQLGTGHAVMCAMPAVPETTRCVVVLCGDVPLLKATTLHRFISDHRSQHRMLSILAVHLSDPTGYGRVVQDEQGNVIGIVEEADATRSERTIKLVNTGIYCIERSFLETALHQIHADNAQGEYYLTDIVGVAHAGGHSIGVTQGDNADEFLGVNSPEQLKTVASLLAEWRA
jgi:UDP-N-acetylglucosamine diphosphorylase/glucosamine-1-phosphate N-acetyltransferase